jgi:hypothetical protein
MPPEAAELFFNVRSLLVPSHLFSEGSVAGTEFLEALMAKDSVRTGCEFVRTDALAVVLALLMALEQVIRAADDRFTFACAFEGLFAEVATNHAIDLGHFLEDGNSFLL